MPGKCHFCSGLMGSIMSLVNKGTPRASVAADMVFISDSVSLEVASTPFPLC